MKLYTERRKLIENKEKAVAVRSTTGTEVQVGQTVKKYMIGLFLQMEEAYKRIKKSTTLELSVEAETDTQDFIADMSPTEMLKNYKVSIAQDLTMIKGEEDFEYVWEHFFNDVPVNKEVNVKCMVAFMFDGDKTAGYKAWETDAKLMFESLNGNDSKINFTINFGGSIRKGLAKNAGSQITFEKQGA